MKTTRRGLLAAASVSALGVAAKQANSPSEVAAAQATPDSQATENEPVGQAEAPAWTFTVLVVQDPYTGEITRPSEPKPGTRFVAAEVVITNGSDQPLDFSTSDVELRDADGVSYSAGAATGSEPKLVSQNLPDHERTRGWVWYAVPENVDIAELRFAGPSPIFRVPIAFLS